MGLACNRTEQGDDTACAGSHSGEGRGGAAARRYALVWGLLPTTVANPSSLKKSHVSGQQVRQTKASRGRGNVRVLHRCCVRCRREGAGRGKLTLSMWDLPGRWAQGLVFLTVMGMSSGCWVRSRDRQNRLILLAVLGQLFYFLWIEGSLCQILGDQQHHAKPSAAAWLATSVTTSLVSIPPPRSLLQTGACTT